MLRCMKSTTLVIAILLVLSVVGVRAGWEYAVDAPETVSEPFDVSMDTFEYAPEEVLPGEEEDKNDGNHWSLIERILNHITYGLNGNRDTMENALKKEGVLYCENNSISGGNLKSLFIDESNSANVRFLLVSISNKEIHAYTYSGIQGTGEQFGKTEIVTYKTVLRYGSHVRKDGTTVVEWYAEESEYGMALVIDPDVKHVERSVDYTRWHT